MQDEQELMSHAFDVVTTAAALTSQSSTTIQHMVTAALFDVQSPWQVQ